MMTNNYSSLGINLRISWVGMQKEHVEDSWEMIREDGL